ncbi:type III secretion system protein YscR [Salmonella enterica subsp. enterica serovar Enteritidis str. 22558]|nr:type III secretion system protein YscR [Salmonella enterica subsp. enterica serovar Enteritidis str. 22558]
MLWVFNKFPQNIALYGLALVLSLFIMGPTLLAVKERWHPVQVAGAPFWTSEWDSKALAPYRQFCKKTLKRRKPIISEFDKTNLA